MNTPSHFLINLTLLGKKDSRKYILPVMIGALLPDLPMFVFFVVESLILHTPNREIWDVTYFEPAWQNFIDCFNSIPIVVIVLGLAWKFKNQFVVFMCLSMLLHIAFDLPVHHDDGHRHFFPFLQWRFESPISYWDPRHFGGIISVLESFVVLVCCFFMLKRHKILWGRLAIIVVSIMQIAGLAFSSSFYL